MSGLLGSGIAAGGHGAGAAAAAGDVQTLELGVDAFNLVSSFNRGAPATNFNSGTFGRITIQEGDLASGSSR